MIQLIRTPPTIWDTADMEPQYDSTQLIQTTPIILDTADMGPTIWDRNEELFASSFSSADCSLKNFWNKSATKMWILKVFIIMIFIIMILL